jgi:quinol monooxygenase YgiN
VKGEMKLKHKKLLIGLIILAVAILSVMFLRRYFWDVINLKYSMPRGNFLEASIVGLDNNGKVSYVNFRIPDDRIQEFEEKFRECIEKVRQAKGLTPVGIIKQNQLRIITDKGKYAMYITWTDEYVLFDGWFRTLESRDFRKILFDMGMGFRTEHNYVIPSKEQTVAILLYPPKISPPLVLLGDKKLAEEFLFEPQITDDTNRTKNLADLNKLIQIKKFGVKTKKEIGECITGKQLEPTQIFKGRVWLEKIMNAYEIALKEAQEREKYFPMKLDDSVGRIVFMTRDEFYWKGIGIDDNAVYDDYIKSEQLKKYFDELGLTKELLTQRPIKEL